MGMLSLVLMLRKSMNSWYGLTCTLLLHASGCCNAFQPVASKISARCHPSRTPASAIGTGSFIHHARTQAQRSWLQPLTIHPYSRSFVVEQLGAVADDFHTESESSSFLVRQSVPATTPADASLLTTRLHPFTQILKRALSKMFSWKSYLGLNSFRRKLATVALAMVLLVFNASSAWAVTGGRMGGGSFKSSPSRSSSGGGGMGRTSTLSRPSPSGRVYFPPPSRIIRHHHYGPSAPIIVNSFSDSRGFYAPTPAIVNTRIMTKDILVLTGTGVLLVYAFRNNYRRNNDYGDVGPLGPGTTVGSVTVALDVPNRSDPENILSKLSRMSMTADTTSKQGLQDLLSAVALELLRQEKAITSAYARSNHYTITGQAEREFQMLSVQSQSKVDRLIVNKFGSKDKSDFRKVKTSGEISLSPTVACVTISFAIEGDSTKLPAIRNLDDLRTALSRISADSQVDDCLLTAEVLWSPEDSSETLSRETVYADFPNLVPI